MSKRLAIVGAALLLAFSGCSNKRDDCQAVFDSLLRHGHEVTTVPKSAKQRDEVVTKINESLKAWDQAKAGIETDEVRTLSEPVAGKLRERKALLEGIDFDAAAKADAPSAEPPAAEPADSAAARKKALAEAAAGAVDSMLGPVPKEARQKLHRNGDAHEQARKAVVDYCMP